MYNQKPLYVVYNTTAVERMKPKHLLNILENYVIEIKSWYEFLKLNVHRKMITLQSITTDKLFILIVLLQINYLY